MTAAASAGAIQQGRGNRAETIVPILFRGPINAYTGYGQLALQIVKGLGLLRKRVVIEPTEFDERFVRVPERIFRRMVPTGQRAAWELLLSPPRITPRPDRRTIYFTMWESDRLPPAAVPRLNAAECVIVPSQWVAECFVASGVVRPIFTLSLGVDPRRFNAAPPRSDRLCVFGTAGRTAGGGMRKGFDDVVRAFQTAFPTERDVRLEVKAFPDCRVAATTDQRVRIVQRFYTDRRLAEWFRLLTCFVSAARAEGWGLMQHQALATGRPLISVRYGGVKDFFDERMGYPVSYRLAAASGFYEGCGSWAEPNQTSLVRQMRRVYEDRTEAAARGRLAARAVARLDWDRFHRELLSLLRRVGMIS